MPWTTPVPINLWLTLLTTVQLLTLTLYSWRQRGVPGASLLALGSLLSAVWIFGSLMETISILAVDKIFWFKFQGILQLPATTAVTCFVFEYTWPGRWLTRRNMVLISLAPVLTLALVLTNDLHHILWRSLDAAGDVMVASYAWGTWLLILYSYSLAVLGIFVFGWLFVRSPQHRWPVAIMLNGMIVARGLYLLELFRLISPPLPIEVLALGYVYLMFGLALFAFGIFKPIELARQTAIAQMRAGILVLDLRDRVASINPAAQDILGISEKQALGRPIQDMLPLQVAFPGSSLPAQDSQVEILLSNQTEPRSFQLALSSLHDWRGVRVGRLLLLRDISEQKRAQAELIEQQHTRATLQERERLARELHDTLVQTTASVRMQAETAGILLERGELGPVRSALEQIADTAQQMHLDLRQYIFDIRTSLAQEQSFFEGLRDFLARFSQTWGIAIELDVPPELERRGLGTSLEQAQVMGIIQEALSNIRKHAEAQRASIRFEYAGCRLSLLIADQGCGFDPLQVSTLARTRFGMRSMSERAQSLGGVFEIHSAPGQGTQVLVSFPFNLPAQEPETT